MSPRCPKCGYEPPRGRPKKLNDKKVRKLIFEGWSLRAIASGLGVSLGAIQGSMKRTKTKASDHK